MQRNNFERQKWRNHCKVYSVRTLCRELCKHGWTDRDAVWEAESGGSRRHVLDGAVDVSTQEHLWGILPIKKHGKAWDFEGWVISCYPAKRLKKEESVSRVNSRIVPVCCTILTYVHNYVNIVTLDYLLSCLVKLVKIYSFYSFFQYYQLFWYWWIKDYQKG